MVRISLVDEVEEESPDSLPRDRFLAVSDVNELAAFFGMSYENLAHVVYGYGDPYKYKTFSIPKKGGGSREICTPCRKLRAIQADLKEVLDEIYRRKGPVHGFVADHSIVTNAREHVGKRHVFNVDLKDFFGSIHFGRVRNLFLHGPFDFPPQVATVLAQICCFQNSLPQGAPTSPVLSNMIARKLDGQLQTLARRRSATYTRYADDITFSFAAIDLPRDVVDVTGSSVQPGEALLQAVRDNGFEINYSKVRLTGRSQRMEVTGLTVNETVNVRRRYVRRLSSMLHAWETKGYDRAEQMYLSRWAEPHSASGQPKSFAHVVHGSLAFLRGVRGGDDPVWAKLASRFNAQLGEDHPMRLRVTERHAAEDALWVVHGRYESDEAIAPSQGTGFSLKDVGIISCWHVVSHKTDESDERVEYPTVEIHRADRPVPRIECEVVHCDAHRDIVILRRKHVQESTEPAALELSEIEVVRRVPLRLLGFPSWQLGDGFDEKPVGVSALRTDRGVKKFTVDRRIDHGNSGGPLVDTDGKVAGVAVERSWSGAGKDGAIHHCELRAVVSDFSSSEMSEAS